MNLAKSIHLKKTKKLSEVCHAAKNLYNLANYHVRQGFFCLDGRRDRGLRVEPVFDYHFLKELSVRIKFKSYEGKLKITLMLMKKMKRRFI
ncbi:MAG: hypothetical protein ACFFAS_16220 [Promethearchaeota archaeon]